MKGVPFANKRYTKGAPFLSKMVYINRVRGWTCLGAWQCSSSELISLWAGKLKALKEIAKIASHREHTHSYLLAFISLRVISLRVGRKFIVFAYFVIKGNFPSTSPQGLIFGGAI